jgi:tripartite-type tricarboxylate transporter receptor subunit TctC
MTQQLPHELKRKLALAIALAIGLPAACLAQAYPTKPIRIVVGYAPGGTTDIIARVLANRLTTTMGQSVIVENRAGAGGNIGAELVARSAPDGYTLQLGTAGNMTVNPSIYPNMSFDTVRDFQPI